MHYAHHFETPLCPMTAVVDQQHRLESLSFIDADRDPADPLRHLDAQQWKWDAKACSQVEQALQAYFDGKLKSFEPLALAPQGTPFRQQVWNQLVKIPYGTTISYGELAARIGNPKASRGVGAANGANPIAVVVPCHRVIGADGTLTGYAGGLDKKSWLLSHEAKVAGLPLPFKEPAIATQMGLPLT